MWPAVPTMFAEAVSTESVVTVGGVTVGVGVLVAVGKFLMDWMDRRRKEWVEHLEKVEAAKLATQDRVAALHAESIKATTEARVQNQEFQKIMMRWMESMDAKMTVLDDRFTDKPPRRPRTGREKPDDGSGTHRPLGQ